MQTKETLSRRPLLSPLLSAPAVLMSLAVALGWGFSGVTLAQGLEETPDVVLIMKDKLFHILKGSELGKSQPTFSLAPKRDVVVLLRNEDDVAHEFVSPLLQKVDLQISGKATMVYTLTAAGVRVDPRESVALRFDVPDAGYDQFHFWCNVHGKLLDDSMRGEIFIVEESSK